VRFLAGAGLGGAALGGYLWLVGPAAVLARLRTVTLGVAVVLVGLLVAEAVVDGLGVWASLRPVGRGLTPLSSLKFALAGDYLDVVSPAGPATSEPLLGRFYAVETDTTYADALGARAAAKYVKSGTQLLVSAVAVTVLLVGGPAGGRLLLLVGGGLVGVVVLGLALVRGRAPVSRAVVAVLAPVVRRVSGLYREPYDRTTVRAAVDRLWTRALAFRDRPRLVALVGVAAVGEQVFAALALWVALSAAGPAVGLVALVAVVPLPQVASVVPVPASLGAYDVLLASLIALAAGVSAAGAAAAVLVVRTVALSVSLVCGGVAIGLLRGWRR
jgi:uncharacterized membrane protein YbhN (UPF0104 family)